jgi:hypothetical protein
MKKWKLETIANTSQRQFLQEYENQFIGSSNTLISPDILASLEPEKEELLAESGMCYIHKEPIEGHTYIMTVDVSAGRGIDYSTFTIIDVKKDSFEQVCIFRDKDISPLLFPSIIHKYAIKYNNALVVIENNDSGQIVCNELYYEIEYDNVFVESMSKNNSVGVRMTKKVKRIGCSNLKDIIENKKLKVVNTYTISELLSFISVGRSFEASRGNHDDLVMNLVMFAWFITTNIFAEISDLTIRDMIFSHQIKQIEDDMVPFMMYDDGIGRPELYEDDTEFDKFWEAEEILTNDRYGTA